MTSLVFFTVFIHGQKMEETLEELETLWNRSFGSHAVVFIHDCPPGIEIGLDCLVYQTGPNFKGFSAVEKGLHILYYSYGNFPRQGFFFTAEPNESLILFSWSKEFEEIVPDQTSFTPEMIINLKASILRGDYPNSFILQNEKKNSIWKSISQFVTNDVLLMRGCKLKHTIAPGSDADESADIQQISKHYFKQKEEKVDSSNRYQSFTFLDLAKIESMTIQSKYNQTTSLSDYQKQPSVGQGITRMKMDKSWLITLLVGEYYEEHMSRFFGDIQLAFILFILLYSYRGLQYWKDSILLLCSSETFLLHNPHYTFTNHFLQLFFYQLNFVHESFFEEEVSVDNFLLPCFNLLSSALYGQRTSGGNVNAQGSQETRKEDEERLEENKRRFFSYISKKFNINTLQILTLPPSATSEEDNMDVGGTVKSAERDETRDALCILGDIASTATTISNDLYLNEEEAPMIVDEPSAQSEELPGGIEGMFEENINPVPYFHVPMDRNEREQLKYSWRYPLLYEEMKRAAGKEDLIMTAMRVLDEAAIDPVKHELIFNEAIKFIENEVPLS